MMPDRWMEWTWGGMWIGHFLWIVLLGLAIWFVATLARRSEPQSPDPRQSRAALDILDERFAKGEIEPEDYERRRQALLGR
jgi:putative membrane protein